MTRTHARRRTALLLALAVALAWTVAPSAGRQAAQGAAPGWGVRFADTVLATWPDPASIDPAKNGWEYNTGIVLFGMSKMYDATKDPRYLAYIKRWVDGYVNDQGVLGWDQSRTHNLDYIQPGMLVLFLYEQTGDPRYRAAAKTVREAFDRIPKNADGGFWHKSQYPNEMWIDGIYMGEPFLVNYGRLFGDAAFGNDMAVFQSTLAATHCLDSKTGLLYHAWDQDRNAAWADPKTGRSPVIWGRGMGWFVMAMVDILEQLPPSHPGYSSLHDLLKKNVAGLARVQDPKTGLWFQVLDQGAGLAGNWIETSSSGMFIYAIKKAVRLKLVEPAYLPVAERAWKGLQATFEQDAAGRPVFTGAVQGMGVQTDAAGYLKIPRLKNSTHGLMAVMIAASEMEPGRGTPAVFRDWPAGASPAEVGRRVAENFAARPFQRPTAFIIYPEVCTWYGALTLASLTGDAGLQQRLVRKFDPLFTPEGSKNISPNAHVDYRVFGTVPLEIFIQTKDTRFLDLGRSFADKQWETTTPDGITSEARYWIDDMFMITAVQVQAFRATGDRKYVDRAALAMVAYLDRLQQPNGLFFHAPDSPVLLEPRQRLDGGRVGGAPAIPAGGAPRAAADPRGIPQDDGLAAADAGRGRPVAPVDRSPGGVARDIGHGHVRLCDGHGRAERVARRADVRAGGAQGLAGPREVHRRRRQYQQRLRGHQQGPDGAVLPGPAAQHRRPARPGPGAVDRVGPVALEKR